MIQTWLETSKPQKGPHLHHLVCRGELTEDFLVTILQYFKQSQIPIQKLDWQPDWQANVHLNINTFKMTLSYFAQEADRRNGFEENLKSRLTDWGRIYSSQDKTNSSAERIAESQSPKRF